MSTSSDAAGRAAHEVAIHRLLGRYGDVVTHHIWDEIEHLFVADAPVTLDLRSGSPIELVGGAEVAAFIGDAVTRFSFFAFTIANAFVVLDAGATPTGALGRTTICEHRLDAESRQWSNAFGLYQDRFRRDGDEWRFARRHYSSLARVHYTAEVEAFPLPPLDHQH